MTDSPALDGAPRPTANRDAERAPGTVARPGVIDVVRLLTELVAFGTLALWGFLAFVLSAIAAALGGIAGTNCRASRTNPALANEQVL